MDRHFTNALVTSSGYQTVDLGQYRGAGADVLPAGEERVLGEQLLQGLPFDIGNGFILPSTPMTIPIEQQAYTVVVAHRLLDSKIPEGGTVGESVAEYVFRLADGSEHRCPIRERFEIAALLPIFGQMPFLALPDTPHRMQSRWSGSWSDAGVRQTEVLTGRPRAYFLWCWANPRPDVPIAALEVLPRGPRFLIAGVTLGLADEHPFVREGAVPVAIDVLDPELAKQSLSEGTDLRLSVDRGTTGYTYPLPAAVSGGFAGWGEQTSSTVGRTYVDVAAIPSATLSIAAGERTIGEVRWGDLVEQRTLETNVVRVRILEDGRNWVQTQVVDDATGQPVPCRVHFRSPEGVPYQPHGHHSHVNSNNDTWHIDVGGDLRLGQSSYAYIDGRCEGWLPRGEVIADVARGYEYEPLHERVTIAPGQRQLALRLKRWTSMNEQGWFSGDTHVHFLSTQGSLREAQSEDLNVVNLLQSQWGSLFTNTEDFTGEPAVSKDRKTIVWTNQENRQHLLGHLILLGLKRPVYPWCSDGPSEGELGGTMETTLSHWADACHAQGGTIVIPHFPSPNAEPAVLVSTGRADAVEMIMSAPYNHSEYYRYLNAGYRVPLVGGTDKMSSQVAVGQYRTYVRIPSDEEFTYDSWCRNLRLGRTFLSGGPLLDFSANGAGIGDTVRLAPGGGTVEVTATARSILPIHTLQIICNGQVVAQADDASGARELKLSERVRVESDSWLTARVGGPNYEQRSHHDVWQRGIFAHTSPIYIACGDDWQQRDPSGLQYMLTLVEGGLEYIRTMAPKHRPGSVTHHHGEDDHLAYLERPFLEALAALRSRL